MDCKHEIKFHQIGVIRTPYIADVPYQPLKQDHGRGECKIVLNAGLEDAGLELDSFKYIYVIFHLDRQPSEGTSTIVTPPWANGKKVGLFASRAPGRPNPIGLSVVELLRIENRTIYTSPIDVFDGTALLDIKPYIAQLDSKADANFGWVDDLDDKEHLKLHLKGIPH